MIEITYSIKHFTELSVHELYQILKLRAEVFIVEQNCVYLDLDDKDLNVMHIMGKDKNGHIHACTRLLDRGVSYPEYPSIGRVVNSQAIRGQGEGHRLMQFSILKIRELFPGHIKIGAQAYLKKFYESLGFEDLGIPYLEDGIPHLKMILK